MSLDLRRRFWSTRRALMTGVGCTPVAASRGRKGCRKGLDCRSFSSSCSGAFWSQIRQCLDIETEWIMSAVSLTSSRRSAITWAFEDTGGPALAGARLKWAPFPTAGLHCQRCVRGESSSTPPALCPAGRTRLWWRGCCRKVPRPRSKTCGRSWLFPCPSTLHFTLRAQVTHGRSTSSRSATWRRMKTASWGFWWFLSRAEPGVPCSCPGLEEPDDVGLFIALTW